MEIVIRIEMPDIAAALNRVADAIFQCGAGGLRPAAHAVTGDAVAPIPPTSPAESLPGYLDVSSRTATDPSPSPPSAASVADLPERAEAAVSLIGGDLPRWSAERDAILAEQYPAGVTARKIRAALNSLPGPEITAVMMNNRCTILGLRRPPGFIPHTTREEQHIAAFERVPPPETLRVGPSADEPEAVSNRKLNYTPAQLRTIKEMMAAGCSYQGIHEALHREPGARPTFAEVANQIADTRETGALSPPPSPEPVARDPDKRTRKPVTATPAFIRAWARNRGIELNGEIDLDAVNAKAEALGLPPFALQASGRTIASIPKAM